MPVSTPTKAEIKGSDFSTEHSDIIFSIFAGLSAQFITKLSPTDKISSKSFFSLMYLLLS